MNNPSPVAHMPAHVAIIMDGNRRWAKKRLLPANAGHKAGATALENLAVAANDLGLKYLTVYAFSTENWRREQSEVSALMNLMRDYLDRYFGEKNKRNMRLLVIGDRTGLAPDLVAKIAEIERLSADKTGLTLVIAINYGGRDELVRAARRAMTQALKTGKNIAEIDETYLARHLDTGQLDIPDPELLIRTSGELRLSNFLLWQAAYTEIVPLPVLWPDFNITHLQTAVAEYHKRTRNLGV